MDLFAITEKVIHITREVGAFIRMEAAAFTPDKIEYKGLNNLVSYVDKTAEQRLVSDLSALLPSAGFLTEEATINKEGETYNWIVDPLDGTTNFIHGIPTFAISIALTRGSELVLGVVYEINRDEMFYAWKDGGAFLNGAGIGVSAADSLSQTLIATGFPYYDFNKLDNYLSTFSELIKNCHGLRRIGAAAVDLAYVAAGRFDGFFEFNLQPWDIAAGALIVKEAGGVVVDFSGGDKFMVKREIIAGTPNITQQLLTTVQKNFG